VKINAKTLALLNKILVEDKEEEEKDIGPDSLDLQVDHYLAEYEKEAKLSKHEGLDQRSMARRFLSNLTEEADKKIPIDDFDVNSFATDLVRLIDNYDSLLETRRTITRRAIKFLQKNYEPDVINSLIEILETNFDVYLDKSQYDIDDEDTAPLADRAGPEVGGSA
jgi:hypothetical protein